MEKNKNSDRVMSQEIFDAMVDGAIDDLKQSGLNSGQIHSIVKAQLGASYARKFCPEPRRAFDSNQLQGQ
jgi:hypothetical protein